MAWWHPDRRRRALTIIEILVTALIILIILGTLFQLLRAGFRQSGGRQEETAGIREAALVAAALREDLARAFFHDGMLHWDESGWPAQLSPSLRFKAEIGSGKKLVVYRQDGDRITRKVIDPAVPGKVVAENSYRIPGLKRFGPAAGKPAVRREEINPGHDARPYRRTCVRFMIEVAKNGKMEDNDTGSWILETLIFPAKMNREAQRNWR